MHQQVNSPPQKFAVSSLGNNLRGVSGRLIRKRGDPGLQRKLSGGSLRSADYFAGNCGDASFSVLLQHIESQRTPSRKDKDSS
ncbi:MAG: transposase [Desulfovibrio sp.]|nr:transposase [Desulfovibrio sp.]